MNSSKMLEKYCTVASSRIHACSFYANHLTQNTRFLILLLFKRVHRELGRDKVLSAEPTRDHFSKRIQNEYFSAIEEKEREREERERATSLS